MFRRSHAIVPVAAPAGNSGAGSTGQLETQGTAGMHELGFSRFCVYLWQRREGLQQRLGVVCSRQLCHQGSSGGCRLVIAVPAKLPAAMKLGFRASDRGAPQACMCVR